MYGPSYVESWGDVSEGEYYAGVAAESGAYGVGVEGIDTDWVASSL